MNCAATEVDGSSMIVRHRLLPLSRFLLGASRRIYWTGANQSILGLLSLAHVKINRGPTSSPLSRCRILSNDDSRAALLRVNGCG
jgi:hypothetical protein